MHAKVVAGLFPTRCRHRNVFECSISPSRELPVGKIPPGGLLEGASKSKMPKGSLGSQGQQNCRGAERQRGRGSRRIRGGAFPAKARRASDNRKRAGWVTSAVASPQLSALNGSRVTPQSRSHSSQEESDPGDVCQASTFHFSFSPWTPINFPGTVGQDMPPLQPLPKAP